mmetsp:Transcript_91687/g.259553  ORF Transcript_91687/g.259553 Transcript_91687/m.259553 type:complete len:206 (+) Transcript_91687:170-787(+)
MSAGAATGHGGSAGRPDEEGQEEGLGWVEVGKYHRPPPLPAPWWFQACCFTYTLIGFHLALHIGAMRCSVPAYPWRVEASLLVVQGGLAFLSDAHFEGRSRLAFVLDKSCATFLTCCQPLKFLFYSMDSVQIGLLLASLCLGLACYSLGKLSYAAAHMLRYQVFHTLWHVALPLGGYLWVEYTIGELPWLRASRCAELQAAARCS